MVLGKSRKNAWIMKYTFMYLMAAAGLYLSFKLQNKSMVFNVDGLYEHFPALYYLREIVIGLFAGEGLPMVDLHLGQGLDTIGTLSWFGLNDPVNLIAALFPKEGLEYAYELLIFLRIYLSGLFLGAFLSKTVSRDGRATAIASLAYAFSGFSVLYVVGHPMFGNGPMYLPLMLLATERLLRERKWLMYVLIACLMLISNFYFAYEVTLMTVMYIVMRLFFRFRERGLKGTARDGFALLGGYLLGAAMAAVVFLPIVLYFFGNSRVDTVGGYTASLWHYQNEHYLYLFSGFVAPYVGNSNLSQLNHCPVVLFGVLYLLMPHKKDAQAREILVSFAVLLLCACVPLVGRVFNGMGYASNRWIYGLSAVTSAATAYALPQLLNAENKNTKRVCLLAAAYAAVAALTGAFIGFMYTVCAFVCVMAFALYFFLYGKCPRLQGEWGKRLLAGMTVVCCLAYAAAFNLPSSRYYTIYNRERVQTTLESEIESVAQTLPDGAFYRVDTNESPDAHQLIWNYYGTGYYWSMIPDSVASHYTDLRLSTEYYLYYVKGLGASSALNELAAVKYCLRPQEEAALPVPMGYRLEKTAEQPDGKKVDVYVNDYPLSIGSVYEKTLSKARYQELNPVEKQLALLTYAVTEDENDAGFETKDIANVDWRIADVKGAKIENGHLTAKPGDTIEMEYVCADENAEVWFFMDGIDTKRGGDAVFSADAGKTYVRFIAPHYLMYYPQKGASVSLGQSKAGVCRFTVEFLNEIDMTVGSVNMYALSETGYLRAAQTLSQNGMTDVKIGTNRISGRAASKGKGVLQLSVPYSKGWTATVDGEKTRVFPSGGMYMGVELTDGAHDVEFRYVTPGIRAGACVSAVALVALGVLLLLSGRKKRKR